jgi:two-component system response regulator GlrR
MPESRISDHVLIVDDETAIRQLLSRWIAALGYRVTGADSAERGVAAMEIDPAAVVFCDIQMPGQGGLWLTSALRARFPDAAIILATGVTTVASAASMRSGVLAYLTKPFDKGAVEDAVHAGMSWHKETTAAGPQPADEGDGVQAWLDSLK